MGDAGGAFGQSFASTLATGLQLIKANEDKTEELTLRKKLVTAQLQAHEADTAIKTRQAQGLLALTHRMSPSEQSTGDMGMGTGGPGVAMQEAAPLSANERTLYRLMLGDHKEALAEPVPHYFDPTKGLGTYDPRTGKSAVAVAPQRPERGALLKEAFGVAQGLNAGGVAPPAPPTGASVPSNTSPAPGPEVAPQAAAGPRVHYFPELAIDKDGNESVKINGAVTHYELKHQVLSDQYGRGQLWEITFDPVSGKAISRQPIGAAVPAEAMQRAMMTVHGYAPDLDPGSAVFGRAVAQVVGAMGLPAAEQAQRLAGVEQVLQSLPGVSAPRSGATTSTGGPAAPTTGGRGGTGATTVAGAITAARDLEVQTAARKAEAEARAKLGVPERPSDATRTALAGQLSTADAYQQISALYQPDFVGPVRGSVGAKIGEKTGAMSQQEQAFRTSLQGANNQMIRDMAGLNQTTGEAERMIRQQPDPTLPPKQFEERLRMTKINQKIIAIRKRQVFEATGVDVSNVPPITLTTEERRAVANPIAQDYVKGQITREEAKRQLMGLGQFGDIGADAFLNTLQGGKR